MRINAKLTLFVTRPLNYATIRKLSSPVDLLVGKFGSFRSVSLVPAPGARNE
jgi:hypothetical protein